MNYFETEKLDNWQIFADRYFKLFINLQIILILLLWKKRFPNIELAMKKKTNFTQQCIKLRLFALHLNLKKYEIENR